MEFRIEELPDSETVAGKCNEVDGYTTHGLIKVSPSGCILPKTYEKFIDRIRGLTVRDDDVYLISNPKCGTTWCQELVWLVANDVDFEGAKVSLNERFPYIDIEGCVSNMTGILDEFEKLPSPRFIKTHLPECLLPTALWQSKSRIIFINRDARDAAISNFHHYQLFHDYSGSLDEFLDFTLKDRVIYSPFWEHALEFWNMRNDSRVLFLRYEELKQDLPAVLHRVAAFFGKTLKSEDIPRLQVHLSVESMRNNKAVNFEELKEWTRSSGTFVKEGNFIRQGTSGGWKKVMSVEMAKKFQEWTKSKIAGTGLDEYYC